MKHLKKGRKFGRVTRIRGALTKSLASSFFMLSRIRTTEAKAKELRPFVEKCITKAKNPTLHNRRILYKSFSPSVVQKILHHAESMNGRKGGYTRVTKLGIRKSDSARMAIIEVMK